MIEHYDSAQTVEKIMLKTFLKRFKIANNRKKVNALALISIHIPKTAGTSFRNTLSEVYGEKEVVRIDIGLVRQETRVREQLYELEHLPPETRVIHGHFSYPLLTTRFSLPPSIPVITWLRDPVERVISNYFYLSKRLAEELEEDKRGLNILKKMQRSLEEYARFEPSQNRMSKFLTGMALEDFFFVGIVEHYNEDLQSLASRLSWVKPPVFHYNATGSVKPDVPAELRALIQSLNQKDVDLYNKALILREQGKWKS